jgi:hypothetical protein
MIVINSTLVLPVTGFAVQGERTSVQVFESIDERTGRRNDTLLLSTSEEFDTTNWPCPQTIENYTTCIRVNLAETRVTTTTTFSLSWLQVVANLVGALSGVLMLLRYSVVHPPAIQCCAHTQ